MLPHRPKNSLFRAGTIHHSLPVTSSKEPNKFYKIDCSNQIKTFFFSDYKDLGSPGVPYKHNCLSVTLAEEPDKIYKLDCSNSNKNKLFLIIKILAHQRFLSNAPTDEQECLKLFVFLGNFYSFSRTWWTRPMRRALPLYR